MKFKVLTTQGYSDDVEISDLEAKNEEEAYEILEEEQKPSDYNLLFNRKKWNALKKEMRKNK